jgi:Ca-activated chloride channel family protein
MTEGRHHRRRDDEHSADGIYVPPPRETPHSGPPPADWPPPASPAPSPWAPAATGPPPAGHPDSQQHARSSDPAGRPAPWAPGDEKHNEEDPYAPAEDLPPAPPAHTDAEWLTPIGPQEWPPIQAQRWMPPVGAPATPPPAAPEEHSPATAWWIAAGVIIVALAVAAGVLVGVRLAARGGGTSSGAAGATCGGRQVLRATVSPQIAPAVEQAAADIGANPAGGCKLIAVTAQETYQGGEAWVPATVAWARLAKFQFAPEPASLARSPVVVAAPRPFAESLGWPGRQPSWAALATALNGGQVPRFSMGAPHRDTAGLLAALEVQGAMARTTKDPGIAQMRALSVRARLADPEASPAALLERMAQQTDPARALRDVGLFPVTEQDLWRYAQGAHPVALAGLYPSDALLEAEYPLLLTPKAGRDGELKSLAARLVERMQAGEFAAVLTGRGLRPATGDAAPTGNGIVARYGAPLELPDGVAEWAATWAQYKRLAYRTLLLVDASASMNEEVHDRSGAVTTKAGLLRAAGVQAAQLFGDETSLGVWMFASPSPEAPPFTVALPFGPMNEKVGDVPRREAMRRIAEGYKAYPVAGTPLFETVLRGVGEMKERHAPDAVNLVVVLTDGRDQDSRFSMPRDQFIARLSALRDPARPVMVFAIGYGGDADMAVLREMAQLTGGQAVASNDPGDLASAMARIFLAAHAPR